jgi:hypothetical protein
MSLANGKTAFISGLVNLQQLMLTKEIDSFEEYAIEFAALVENFIKSADVKTGITVSTTGSATAQTGSTTSKGTLE